MILFDGTPGDPSAGVGGLNWLAAPARAGAPISNIAALGAQKRVACRVPLRKLVVSAQGTTAGGLPDGSRKKTSVV